MFIQDNLEKLKMFSDEHFPSTKFLIMFIGAVICPYLLLAIGDHSPGAEWQSALARPFLVIAALFLTSVVCGLMMFRHKSGIVKGVPIKPSSY